MKVGFRALDNQRDWDWVCHIMPMKRCEDTNGIIAYNMETGIAIAAMICEDWTPVTVTCHFVVEDKAALRHKFHNECANFVFTQGGRRKMYGLVPANNDKALSLNKHFGFKELIRLEDGFDDGVDYVLMELLNKNCPYWEGYSQSVAA